MSTVQPDFPTAECWFGPRADRHSSPTQFRRASLGAPGPAGTVGQEGAGGDASVSIPRNVENNPGCVNNCQRTSSQHFWLRPQQSFSSHVSSPQALGAGYPHKAPQGSSAPAAGGLWAPTMGKRYSTGSSAGAARLGRPRTRSLARTQSRHLQRRIQLSQMQPMTWRSKAAPIASGQRTFQVVQHRE